MTNSFFHQFPALKKVLFDKELRKLRKLISRRFLFQSNLKRKIMKNLFLIFKKYNLIKTSKLTIKVKRLLIKHLK